MNKTRFFSWILLFLVTCCACNNPANNNKSELLPMDSVAHLVADCYFIESEIYVKQWEVEVNENTELKYDSLFKKHGLTKESFVKNVKYYSTNEKYAEKFINKIDAIIEQRTTVLRDSLE